MTLRPMRSKLLILASLALSTSACQTIGNFADDVGSHMPTIGERCEHWQCFTESGQRQSDMNKLGVSASEAAPAPAPNPPSNYDTQEQSADDSDDDSKHGLSSYRSSPDYQPAPMVRAQPANPTMQTNPQNLSQQPTGYEQFNRDEYLDMYHNRRRTY